MALSTKEVPCVAFVIKNGQFFATLFQSSTVWWWEISG